MLEFSMMYYRQNIDRWVGWEDVIAYGLYSAPGLVSTQPV